ncbi:hypothetical protein B0H21DRAFT_96098 [Amylocystis lapponica]|nr:hypothetical protein B0H21DRAFT_96098 [Amylocystis lapponica]
MPRQMLLSRAEPDLHMKANVSLNETLGAALIGHTVSLFLNGCTWVQMMFYFRRKHDRWNWEKTIVVILWLLDNAHVALVSEGLYNYLVKSHGNAMGILRPAWSFGVQVYVTGLSNVIVRSVYAYRIWRLSLGISVMDTAIPVGNLKAKFKSIVPIIIVILSLYIFATGCIFGTIGVQAVSWLDNQHLSWSVYSSYGVEIVTDGIIAVSMSLLLIHIRRKRPRGISESIIQTFIVYSIYTGVLTTICIVLTLISYIAVPHSFVYLAFYFVFAKLYVISLLGSLNAPLQSTEQPSPTQTPSQLLTTAIIIHPDPDSEFLDDVEDVRDRGLDVRMRARWTEDARMFEAGRGMALGMQASIVSHDTSFCSARIF